MASRKRALLALLTRARAFSARPFLSSSALHAPPESAGPVVADAVRSLGPRHYAAFAAFAGVGGYAMCAPSERQLMMDDSNSSCVDVQEGFGSESRIATSLSNFILSAVCGDMYSNFRGPSSRDLRSIAKAIRQNSYELRKSREYARTQSQKSAEKPKKHWLAQLDRAIDVFTRYIYLPETVGDISAYLVAALGGSMVLVGDYSDPTWFYLLDPSMCFECPFSGCLSLNPLLEEGSLSSDDPSDSEVTGEASDGDSKGSSKVTGEASDGDSKGSCKVGLQCILSDDTQSGDKSAVSSEVKVSSSTHQFKV